MNLTALYVYSIIVGWIFITGVGLLPFVPEEVAVAGLGIGIGQNPNAIPAISWLVCLAAVLGTDLFLYAVGRIGGPVLMSKRWVQKLLKPERMQVFAHKFQEKGIWFMLTARLIPGWRSAVFITAGVIQYPVGRFCLADAISAVPLVTFFFFGGYYAADTINAFIANIQQAQDILLLIVIVGVLIVGAVLYVRWMRAQEKKEAVEEAIEHIKMEESHALGVEQPMTSLEQEKKEAIELIKNEESHALGDGQPKTSIEPEAPVPAVSGAQTPVSPQP